MQYTIDHFIKKFEAIPEENWTTGKFINASGQKCALGHCMVDDKLLSPEFHALREIFCSDKFVIGTNIGDINDGNDDLFQQSTPKQRVLAALNDVKKRA